MLGSVFLGSLFFLYDDILLPFQNDSSFTVLIPSTTSRKYTNKFSDQEIKELKKFSQNLIKENDLDGVILGHTHTPEVVEFEKGTYFNSGDWISHFTYLETDNGEVRLKSY